jgi:hypothetical protein
MCQYCNDDPMCERTTEEIDLLYRLQVENAKLKKHNVRLKNKNREKQMTINKLMKRLRLLDPKQLYYNSQKGVRRK